MDQKTEGLQALQRLFRVALRDTGQSRRVANFLLAWHNAEENGGWDPVDLWNVDTAIAEDMLTVLRLIRECITTRTIWVSRKQIEAVWEQWRGARV
ncbi:MAG TPA: hypothetical protein VLI55_21120 [Bryobacteraceae bacterium]|nr:hypothetical protein [Bryobacteraceae bacterium]